jgi:hypothetical protein
MRQQYKNEKSVRAVNRHGGNTTFFRRNQIDNKNNNGILNLILINVHFKSAEKYLQHLSYIE